LTPFLFGKDPLVFCRLSNFQLSARSVCGFLLYPTVFFLAVFSLNDTVFLSEITRYGMRFTLAFHEQFPLYRTHGLGFGCPERKIYFIFASRPRLSRHGVREFKPFLNELLNAVCQDLDEVLPFLSRWQYFRPLSAW